MSILVFALGGLLSAGGALAIYLGYDIVQVERGWSSVIAGAAALSGGVVTIGLGFVLRALGDLKAAFRQGQAAPPASGATPVAAVSAVDHVSVEAGRVEPSPVEPVGVELVPAPESSHPGIDASVLQAAILQAVEAVETADAVTVEPPKPLVEAAAAPKPSEIRPTVSDMWRLVNEELEQPLDLKPAQKDSVVNQQKARPEPLAIRPARLAPVEPPASLPTPPPPEPAEARVDEPAHESEEPEGAPPALSPPPAPAAPPAAPPPRPTPEPTVIGRYESDGTTYTMFADGSIEAQSEEGVFRFASMAELKAYVESRA